MSESTQKCWAVESRGRNLPRSGEPSGQTEMSVFRSLESAKNFISEQIQVEKSWMSAEAGEVVTEIRESDAITVYTLRSLQKDGSRPERLWKLMPGRLYAESEGSITRHDTLWSAELETRGPEEEPAGDGATDGT